MDHARTLLEAVANGEGAEELDAKIEALVGAVLGEELTRLALAVREAGAAERFGRAMALAGRVCRG